MCLRQVASSLRASSRRTRPASTATAGTRRHETTRPRPVSPAEGSHQCQSPDARTGGSRRPVAGRSVRQRPTATSFNCRRRSRRNWRTRRNSLSRRRGRVDHVGQKRRAARREASQRRQREVSRITADVDVVVGADSRQRIGDLDRADSVPVPSSAMSATTAASPSSPSGSAPDPPST